MRKLLLAVGLALTLAAVEYGGRMTSATQTCTATCEGGYSLSCTVASGTCSSSSGSVTCCGTTHTCTAIDAWYVCFFECVHGFPPGAKPEGARPDIQQNCTQQCGSASPTNFSC